MKGLKGIVLDFDGVLVESVGIKDRAYEIIFGGYPHFDEIIEYCHANNATIRFDKFRHVYQHILRQKYTEDIEKELSRKFSQLVVQKIIECPSVPGALEFLDFFYKKVPMYLASINSHEELKRILEARNMAHYLKDVYTIPWLKEDALKDILKNENSDPDQVVFIGDSPEDYQSAQKAGVRFIGRSSNKRLDQYDISVCRDLFEVMKIMNS